MGLISKSMETFWRYKKAAGRRALEIRVNILHKYIGNKKSTIARLRSESRYEPPKSTLSPLISGSVDWKANLRRATAIESRIPLLEKNLAELRARLRRY